MKDKQRYVSTECIRCRGTGITKSVEGMEAANVAIVCTLCSGTGCYVYRYVPFAGRKEAQDIAAVFALNPGIRLEANTAGGLPYHEWQAGKPLPTDEFCFRPALCPLGYVYHIREADWNGWAECIDPANNLSWCCHFEHKAECWAKWDALAEEDRKALLDLQ